MQRSAGVSTIAIVVLIGSILVLGLGVLEAGLALVMPQMPARAGAPFVHFAAFMLIASLMYILPGVWGVMSGIGLWRLRNWARISTLVFAALAGLGGIMALAGALLFFAAGLPTSESMDPATAARALAVARGGLMIGSTVLLGTAIWFGVLLTRPRVIEQFGGSGGGTAATGTGRPVSITIIAVLMLIGAPFALVNLLIRAQVPLFTMILSGGAAVAYALAIAGLLTYCGVGLLRLKPLARLVSIGYFVVGILSSSVFFLAPGRDARLSELMAHQHVVIPSLSTSPPPAVPTRTLMGFALVAGLVGGVVPLYFLVTRGAAFAPAPSDPIWPDAPGGYS